MNEPVNISFSVSAQRISTLTRQVRRPRWTTEAVPTAVPSVMLARKFVALLWVTYIRPSEWAAEPATLSAMVYSAPPWNIPWGLVLSGRSVRRHSAQSFSSLVSSMKL